MIELQYKDSYQQLRSQTYEDIDAILLALSGCMTVPDYYKVSSLTYQGKPLDYTGTLGDLYAYLSQLNQDGYFKN